MDSEHNENSELEELTEKIGELEELIKANHRMVRTLYRRSQYATLISVVKWVVIIGFTIGAFYYVQPYLDTVLKAYSTIANFTGGHQASTSTNAFVDFFKNIR